MSNRTYCTCFRPHDKLFVIFCSKNMFSFCVCAFWLHHYGSHEEKFSEQACRIKKNLDWEQTVCGIFFWLIGVIQFTEERGFNTGSDESNDVFSLCYDSILHIICRHKDLQFSPPTRQHTQLTLCQTDFYKSDYFLKNDASIRITRMR